MAAAACYDPLPRAMPTLAVLVVEDDPATRAYVAASVRAQEGLRLAAEADTLTGGFEALKRYRPQVVLVDLGLPDGSGLKLIRAASALSPAPDVMVISSFGDEKSVLAAVEAGAGGYLLKDGSEKDIGGSILRLAAGEAPISPAIAAHLVRRLRGKPPAAEERPEEDPPPLTARERDVLELVAKGLSYEEIGDVLRLRYHTIASYIKGIYRKLAVSSRGEAVFEARQMGLLE
jgi:DNA-binding NarL/FixJ family response regulator